MLGVARRLAQWKEEKKKVSSKHPAHGPAKNMFMQAASSPKRPGHLDAKHYLLVVISLKKTK